MYHRVFVAGTFDHLHTGHDAILTAACNAGEEVTVGLTSDAFVAKFKKDHTITPFTERKAGLEQWLSAHGYGDKTLIVPIDDPYEPAASLTDLEVLVVTPENKSRGEEINRIRKEKGLTPLGLLVVALVPAEDSKPVSSTRVREGEIDKTGRLIMPDNLRPELGKPMGQVLIGDAIGSSIEAHRRDIIVTVGDITTKTLLTAGVTPSLSIVDFQVKRKPYPELDGRFAALNIFRVQVPSGPGFIAKEAIEVIQKWSLRPEEKIVLAVSGEEDLLALPAIAYGPLSAVVYYGQPGKGAVEVVINQEKKNQAIALLEKFT
ncbi:MAG: pantetheine-phosphate adenylyltransferase [Candidatus Gottesmanbacteria bacterium]|nr:pantetheine-phosphate adenylyltransferase [Candidatus Gottesmanbacteria bacterium]